MVLHAAALGGAVLVAARVGGRSLAVTAAVAALLMHVAVGQVSNPSRLMTAALRIADSEALLQDVTVTGSETVGIRVDGSAQLAAGSDGCRCRRRLRCRARDALQRHGTWRQLQTCSVFLTSMRQQALRQGRIAAAGLDVFEGEPKVHPDLLAVPNVVLTPHIASATIPTRLAMANLAADNLIGFLTQGRALTPLNPEVLAR